MKRPTKAVPPPLEFRPDWSKIYTGAKAEAEFSKFKFKGPGWYLSANEAMLVIPVDGYVYTGSYKDPVSKSPWRQRWPKDQLFHFHYFSGDPTTAFCMIANAAVRVDERGGR